MVERWCNAEQPRAVINVHPARVAAELDGIGSWFQAGRAGHVSKRMLDYSRIRVEAENEPISEMVLK
jgi:hypothetical protein